MDYKSIGITALVVVAVLFILAKIKTKDSSGVKTSILSHVTK